LRDKLNNAAPPLSELLLFMNGQKQSQYIRL
jgi:hypothetical protein